MISLIITHTLLFMIVVLLLLLLWPIKIILHFDEHTLYAHFDFLVKKITFNREMGHFLERVKALVIHLIPNEILKGLLQLPLRIYRAIKQTMSSALGDALSTFKRKPTEDSTENLANIAKSEDRNSQEMPNKEASFVEKELQQDRVTGSFSNVETTAEQFQTKAESSKETCKMPLEESDPVENAKESSQRSTPLHEIEEEIVEEVSDIIGQFGKHWGTEAPFAQKIIRWTLRVTKIAIKLIIPQKMWLIVEGGVEDPKTTSDFWVLSHSLSSLISVFNQSARISFVPQFQPDKKWKASGEFIFRFNILRLVSAVSLIVILFPWIATIKFYLRWRPEKEAK